MDNATCWASWPWPNLFQTPKDQFAMPTSFKTGDIVKLKSGGPEMTVTEVDPPNIYCSWFAGKKLEDGRFPRGSLIHAKEVEKKD